MKHPLVLSSGSITRSHSKKYGVTMKIKRAWIPQLLIKIRGRIFSRKGRIIRNHYHSTIDLKEAWRTPKFLTLMEAHVEMESEIPAMACPRPCYVSTPVQGGTPQAVQTSASREGSFTLKHARAHWHAPDRASHCLSRRKSYIEARPCQLERPRPCTPLPLARSHLH
ncbi:hypothetical protein JCGZ_15205 [Jatropha curcas]|uniref:Uncharacterized protein n=1 Tax=Jatropha curcas TaxID=180498 RepID=A0A067KH08_JATCU|nr:hypothetical protein JCGZ_15205 [Jatropha curcas]